MNTFGSLRDDKDFTDVTLACEDGKQVEVHKVVLANSSPFFQNILRRKKHTHPLIFMRGVKSADLLAIIDFVYSGEANVFQENLESFLAIAQELQLKGLIKEKAADDWLIQNETTVKMAVEQKEKPILKKEGNILKSVGPTNSVFEEEILDRKILTSTVDQV